MTLETAPVTTLAKKRAPFSKDLQPLRDYLPGLIKTLEPDPSWYGSIYFERKSTRTLNANLKQSNISDDVTAGVVLRIYDGYTLFEEASDQFDEESLVRLSKDLVSRVRASQPKVELPKRSYMPPPWAERLKAKLDPEIRSQIPSATLTDTQSPPRAETPVHFGVRFESDPKTTRSEVELQKLKALVTRGVELAPSRGIPLTELTFAMARQSFAEEESIFVDRETNLSQTLYRLSLMVMLMSGSERAYSRVGALGGLEILRFSDSDLIDLLDNLKGMKTAERLTPGKYQVLLGPELAGVLAHEAFGHSQEADTCARGRSKAWDLYHSGEKVGNDHATILNNPAIFENADSQSAAWGSYFFDEEGWLAQEQVLLDRGVLRLPMTNLTSAIRLGIPRTANGKRESWANGVYTRQTNTYFSAGAQTLKEIMSQVKEGFLATEPAGGMEDPKGMGIQVGIYALKEIKDGKLTGRVFRGPAGGAVSMTGYVPDVLGSILSKSKIQYDSESADEVSHPFNDMGGCGKYHKEYVHAGSGGPYMLLDQVTLG